jgi:hypothetical protein
MTDTKYNGWTNYATWRINLEIFDGASPEELLGEMIEVSAENLEDYVEEILFGEAPDGLIKDYASAFVNDVNWQEIADSINDTFKQEIEENL